MLVKSDYRQVIARGKQDVINGSRDSGVRLALKLATQPRAVNKVALDESTGIFWSVSCVQEDDLKIASVVAHSTCSCKVVGHFVVQETNFNASDIAGYVATKVMHATPAELQALLDGDLQAVPMLALMEPTQKLSVGGFGVVYTNAAKRGLGV